MTDLSTTELCDRFAKLYPGAVTDVLDQRGIYDQTLNHEIDPLAPHMQTAGIAYPIIGRPNRSVDPETNIRKLVQMLTEVPTDSVLLYQTSDEQCSHIGELSARALQIKGCRGAVVDGGARDVAHILEHEFPVFASYTTPADAVPRWEILEWGVSAVVGSVAVKPGDVVVADIDGVVVVPRAIADDVLEAAEAIASTENAVRTAIEEGMTPIDAYEKYGKF